jgi:hypothetical protein
MRVRIRLAVVTVAALLAALAGGAAQAKLSLNHSETIV